MPDNESTPQEVVFTARTYTFANADRPYRRAGINPKEGVTPSVIVYLHGGSAKGNDNSKQMEEPGIKTIADYASAKGISAVMKPDEVNLQLFLDDVKTAGGLYKFDTEDDWDHEMTCKESYTSRRLDWVFSHR